MPKLAQRMSRAKPSTIMLIAEKANQLKAEGRDIISFSIGVPNFLPGPHVYEAVRDWLDKDSGSYGSNRGSKPLLDAFLGHMQRLGLAGYGATNCAVAVGAKHILYNLAEALLDDGDEIAFPTPYWTSYLDIAEILGAKVKLLPCPPEQNYKLTPAQLDEALASKPEDLPVQQPVQPDRHGLHQATRSPRWPTCWSSIRTPGSSPTTSTTAWCSTASATTISSRRVRSLRERVIFVDSLSKTYGMPGWRVGLMAGPRGRRRRGGHAQFQPHHQHPRGSLGGRRGRAVRPAGRAGRQVRRIRQAPRPGRRYPQRHRRRRLPTAAGRVLRLPGHLLRVRQAPRRHRLENDVDVCAALLEAKGVACVPGSAFGEPRGLRISYTCPAEQLEPGMQRIQEFFAELS